MRITRTLISARTLLSLAILLGLSATAAFAQEAALPAQTQSKPESPEAKNRREAFELVWQTVNKNFYDSNFNGVDWKAVHDRYAPKVARATSDHELYSVLQLMVNELHQSHFWIIPPEAIPKLLPKDEDGQDKNAGEESDSEDNDAEADTPLDLIKQKLTERLSTGIGIDLRVVDGQVLITRVEAGSAAARAGLRPGFVIKSVDGKPLAEVLAELDRNPIFRVIIRPEIPLVLVANYINGDLRDSVKITYADGRNLQHKVRINRERLRGGMSPAIGNLPPLYTEFEAKRLAGGIGYIRFNAFVPNLMKKVCATLREMHDAPGIIFDLRGNQGGLLGMIGGLGGLVQEYPSVFGSMKMRTSQTPVLVTPQRAPYTGALAIVIDGSTQSAAEIFAAGMQETHRAVIVGDVSAGNTLPSGILKLPTGALFQYAFGNYQTPEGIFLEGRGVIPDQIVKLNRRALLHRGDPQLAAALEKLRERISPPVRRELIADVTAVDLLPKKPAPGPTKIEIMAPPPALKSEPAGEGPKTVDPNALIAEQVVARYIRAVGGEAALLKIKNRVSTGDVELPMGLNGTVEVYEEAPNRSSVIMNLKGFGILQQTFNGRIRWLQDPVRGYLKISEAVEGENFHHELELKGQLSSLRFERKERVGDRDCFVLGRFSRGIVIERLYFDLDTGLLVRENNTYLEDYRDVDGVKIAFVARQEGPRGMATVLRLKEVKQNVTIDQTKFAERADCFTRPDQNWRSEN